MPGYFADERTTSEATAANRVESRDLRLAYFHSLTSQKPLCTLTAGRIRLLLMHTSLPHDDVYRCAGRAYDLHMTVERFTDTQNNETDRRFIRK